MRDPGSRLLTAAAMLAITVAVSSTGLYVLGDGRWTVTDCVYFTFITLTTVGYGETLESFSSVQHARQFTVLILVLGMGTVLYFVSTLTASIVEGDLRRAMRRTRMNKQIARMKDHVVVCGTGSTGRQVIAELIAAGVPTVAIDISDEKAEHVARQYKEGVVKYVVGDATDDTVLEEANVSEARGVVAALANDKDNLYLVVTCRQANAQARIVARGSDLQELEKLRKAGANAVVSPNYIGGMRMVSELLRPQAVRFLDEMLREEHSEMRIEEAEVPPGSPLVGKALKETGIRRETDALVLALRLHDGSYHFNPGADVIVDEGMTLVVLGTLKNVKALRRLVAGDT